MRERLTYRLLLQLFSPVIPLLVGIMWLFQMPLPIAGIEQQHEPLLVVTAASGALLFAFASLFRSEWLNNPVFAPRDGGLTTNQRTKNRENMLTLVDNIWIGGFLDHILNEGHALNLNLEFAEPDKVLQRPGMTDYTLPDSTAIARAFSDLRHQNKRRMVILGEPGAGKTVTLLQLAAALLAEARQDAHQPIPVVLALSSWAAKQLPFEDWLIGELREKYALPKKVAEDFVRQERLLYLLDGLDEVAEEQRKACLEVIRQFSAERPIEFALCSRRAEWQALATTLNIPGEVVIQPLTPDSIARYLASDRDFAGLRAVLAEHPMLQTLAYEPFMLNTMAVVARGIPAPTVQREIALYRTPHDLRAHFLEAYVNRRLREQPNPRGYDAMDTRRWLGWLARQLVKHDRTDSYIEGIHPSWLDNQQQERRYQRRVGLGVGLALGLATGLALALAVGLGFGLAFGLGVGLALGLDELAVGRSDLVLVDQLRWSSNTYARWFGLLTGLVSALALLVGSTLSTGPVSALAFGLGTGLVFWLAGGFETSETTQTRIQPAQGLRRTQINAIGVTLIVGLVATLVVTLSGVLAGEPQQAISVSTWIGLAVGLMFGLLNGGRALIQHYILRAILARAGHLPYWRYDKFLDYAADLVILRKVGGGYRFAHDTLRQYLARSAPDTVGGAKGGEGQAAA